MERWLRLMLLASSVVLVVFGTVAQLIGATARLPEVHQWLLTMIIPLAAWIGGGVHAEKPD